MGLWGYESSTSRLGLLRLKSWVCRYQPPGVLRGWWFNEKHGKHDGFWELGVEVLGNNLVQPSALQAGLHTQAIACDYVNRLLTALHSLHVLIRPGSLRLQFWNQGSYKGH